MDRTDIRPGDPETDFQGQKILIIDDTPANLGVVSDSFENHDLKVLVARTGESGLKKARYALPDLILLDVLMPGVDGFEVCRRLKAAEETRDIPVIFMTALNKPEDIVKGFEAGGVDFISKPIHVNELVARVTTHLRLKLKTQELALANKQITRLNRQLNSDNMRLQTEMELAKRLQTGLQPNNIEHIHPDFEIAAVMLPAEEIGGDYYDVLYDKEGNLWFGIGDVSGHGFTPGLIMMMGQTIFATLVKCFPVSPAESIINLNKMLFNTVHERLNEQHIMTFTALKYLGSGDFQHCGAHIDLIVYRNKTKKCETIKTKGTFLNFMEDITHAAAILSFSLEKNDILFLYTDGIIEMFNEKRKMLDIKGFQKIIEKHARHSPEILRDNILKDVLNWGNNRLNDDISLLVIKRIK